MAAARDFFSRSLRSYSSHDSAVKSASTRVKMSGSTRLPKFLLVQVFAISKAWNQSAGSVCCLSSVSVFSTKAS